MINLIQACKNRMASFVAAITAPFALPIARPIALPLVIIAVMFLANCDNSDTKVELSGKQQENTQLITGVSEEAQAVKVEPLPENINWLTNDTAPVFSSPKAKKGGMYKSYILSFPLTLRTVGPDSNGSFRGNILDNQMSLLDIHPNTEEILPALATHWAYGEDKKTMYFKLNPAARWSDGHPVTADDFIYTLRFMRSKHIRAPWYNNYYTEEIDKVVKYDKHTLAVISKKAKPDLHMTVGLSPTPQHFYGELDKDFVRKFNWKIMPNTGAYQIDKVKKGKSVSFKRKKNWWAKDLKYYKNRFNVDLVVFNVIRDQNVAFEYFKKQQLDDFGLTLPQFWHEKSVGLDIVDNGYVEKAWFYTDAPIPSRGFRLNQALPLFKDQSVRYAFAHAINTKTLLSGILRNDYSQLHNAFTGYGDYTNKTIKAREFNINKVSQLMTDSGWRRGQDGIWEKGQQRFSVKVTYGAEHLTDRLVVLKEEAKKAGVELILHRLDGSSSFKAMLEKKHQVAFMAFGTGFRPAYWEFYHSVNADRPQTNNLTNTSNPEMDKLIEKYRNSLDVKERMSLSKQIQAKVHEIGAFVPLYKVDYFRQMYWRWWQFPEVPSTKISGSLFEPFSTGLFWLDQDIKNNTVKLMAENKGFKPVTRVFEQFRVTD